MPNYIIHKVVRGKPLVRGGALPPSVRSQFQHIERFILALQRLAAYNFVGRSDAELDNFDTAIARMSEEIMPLVNYLNEVARENPSLAGVADELKMRLQAVANEATTHLERYDDYLAEIEG